MICLELKEMQGIILEFVKIYLAISWDVKKLIELFEKLTGEERNQESKNGRFYIETVECIGACGIAPAFMIDDDLYDGTKITEEKLNEILSKYV